MFSQVYILSCESEVWLVGGMLSWLPNAVPNKASTEMALLTLHSIPLVREYQSTLISRASFFACFCFLLCVFAPLLVAYSSHGFWVKYDVYREQPDVRFKYQALLLARSSTSDITWSTFSEYNSLAGQYLHFPSITVSLIFFSVLNTDGNFNMYFWNCRLKKKTKIVTESWMDLK